MKNIIVSILISTAVASSAYAQQSVRFTNVNPEVVVPLLTNTMSFSSTGNILASCRINTATNTCQGVVTTGGGSNGLVPTVSIASTPSAAAPFTTATTFTISPTVTNNPVVCTRDLVSGPAAVSSWTGATTTPSTSTVVSFPAVGTYILRETCFNSAGSGTSNQLSFDITVILSGACGSFVPTLDSLGFTRETARTTIPSAFQTFDFPFTGQMRPVGVGVNKYLALEFTTPPSPWYGGGSGKLSWLEAQGNGIGQIGFSDAYLTITKCAGDFRLPTNDPKDPTSFGGCRNLRQSGTNPLAAFLQINLRDNGTAPSASVCSLQGNTKYYLNFVGASPTNGGFLQGENNCSSILTNGCGFQMQFE